MRQYRSTPKLRPGQARARAPFAYTPVRKPGQKKGPPPLPSLPPVSPLPPAGFTLLLVLQAICRALESYRASLPFPYSREAPEPPDRVSGKERVPSAPAGLARALELLRPPLPPGKR